jgi:hypothetical protein
MVIGCLLATCKILPKSSFIVKLLSGFSDFKTHFLCLQLDLLDVGKLDSLDAAEIFVKE